MKICFRRMIRVIVIGYSMLLSYWMIFGFGRITRPEYMYNLKPFATINQYLHINSFNPSIWIVNLAGNIGVFVPFGILIPLTFGGRYMKLLGTFLSGLFVLEVLQLITKRGSFDIDDFILNTIGVTIGYSIYRIAKGWVDSEKL
ncbi:VanZ family protein [Anaerosolibacter sp.]|uniref:VanZ family protein n=1 Tax=Anaerosolibacter sp. TaxID=1872527 RepID=UPI0039EF0281